MTALDSATRPAIDPWWWVATGALAIGFAAVDIPILAAMYEVPLLLAFVVGIAYGGALPLSLLRPRASAAVVVAASAAVIVTGSNPLGAPWPIPVVSLLSVHALIAVVTLRGSWRLGLIILGAVAAVGVLAVLGAPDQAAHGIGVNVIVFAGTGAVVFGTALAITQRAVLARELATARRAAVDEQERRMIVEERSRIARDLHDIVAHSMSVVHMQAGSAPYRHPQMDDAVREEFAAIAGTARGALTEMRSMLGLLRGDGDAAHTAPQPGADRIRELVEQAERAGVPVDLTVGADVVELPASLQLIAYRIVQEGLANVVRHAPGARTTVRVTVGHGTLTVTVVNDRPAAAVTPVDEGGHGVAGMRERAAAAGGTLSSRQTATGGFHVVAELPIVNAGVTA